MGTRLLSIVAILSVLAAAGCTTAQPVRGYTRPDCAQDYLTGPKFPCYYNR
jgi:hypothetical protein